MDAVERLFWSLAIFFGLHFVWLGFIEDFVPMPYGSALAAILALFFFFRGYRYFEPKEARRS